MQTEDRKSGQLVERSPSEASPQPGLPTEANPCNIFAKRDVSSAMWCTLSDTEPKDVALALRLGTTTGTNWSEWINRTFIATDVHICKWGKADDNTGEWNEGDRVTLISGDRQCLMFAGDVAIKSFRRLCAFPFVGLPPWRDGLPLTVRHKQDGDKQTYWFEIPEDLIAGLIARSNGKA